MCHGHLGPQPSWHIEPTSSTVVDDVAVLMALHLGVVVDKAQARLDCGRSTAHSQGVAFTQTRNPHSVGATECGFRQKIIGRRLGSSCGAPTRFALFAPRRYGPLLSAIVCMADARSRGAYARVDDSCDGWTRPSAEQVTGRPAKARTG